MKGCSGCLGLIVLLVVLAFFVAIFGGHSSQSPSSSSLPSLERPTPSSKHGWVTAAKFSQQLDFWNSLDAWCRGTLALATEIVEARNEGRDPDYSIVHRLPGHRDLENGIRVAILGHEGVTCPDTTTEMRFTRIRVTDSDSVLRGEIGYVFEGTLSKQ